MDEDWRNAFGILMCKEICDRAGAGRCDGGPWTCSSLIFEFVSTTQVDLSKLIG